MATVADQRIHGTPHARPIERFARETLTPLGARAPYRYEQEQVRRVPTDALGRPVLSAATVRRAGDHNPLRGLRGERVCIAQHAKAPRHAVVMDRAH